MNNSVKNYYQGIYLTETILGNPNGDFIDNSPRNIDGKVFTTDKCIKYNVRKYIHENYENINENNEINDFVFFYPRRSEDIKNYDSKFQTKEKIFEDIFEKDFDLLLKSAIDIRMFGGTFSFKKKNFAKQTDISPKQIYGPIQLSYGKDINNAQIKELGINAPFPTGENKQTTNGSEAVVDDAIISYDITINPNNYPGLLKESDLELFKKSLWFGTNLRKSTSKKTDSKLLLLVKFKNDEENDKIKSFNIGEIKELISIKDKEERKRNVSDSSLKIDIDTSKLENKLKDYCEFIEKVIIYRSEEELEINLKLGDESTIEIEYIEPKILLKEE
ncbi:MAG: type I CRISPR-associated protein Cas7 [Methanobrevibacter sp.]|nr:type I CRISPR-associated protein Cas7 [Candidatus Methanoflexus mossambicus]